MPPNNTSGNSDQEFRVTTDQHRTQSMMDALRRLHVPNSMGASLFFFTTRNDLRAGDPLACRWLDGNGGENSLI